MAERDSSLPGLLYWLALVPTAVFLGLEAQVKRVIGGRLRVYNAVDLSVMTVFYHVLFEVRVCKGARARTTHEAANGRVCGGRLCAMRCLPRQTGATRTCGGGDAGSRRP